MKAGGVSQGVAGASGGRAVRCRIEAGDPLAPDVAALLAASEAHSRGLYPPESVHMLDVAALSRPDVCFLVGRTADGKLAGCGALVSGQSGAAELKRMFVDAGARRCGFGSALLTRLEEEARTRGLQIIHLETGVAQPEAIALYRAFGYVECPPFPPYRPDPLSVFMKKELRQ